MRKTLSLYAAQPPSHPCWVPSAWHLRPRRNETLSVSGVVLEVDKLYRRVRRLQSLHGGLLLSRMQPERKAIIKQLWGHNKGVLLYEIRKLAE